MPMIATCPACGAQYTMDDAYLAQYAGHMTTCTHCQAQFPVPQASAVVPGTAGLGYAGPPALNYQSAFPGGIGVFRQGIMVVASKGATLPPGCYKCGSPDTTPMRKKFYWHHPTLYLLILLNILIFAIVAMCVRKSGEITLNICGKHRGQRLRYLWLGWLGFLAGLVGLIASASARQTEPLLILGAVLVMGGGLVFAVIGNYLIASSKVTNEFVVLKGACTEYLNTLPEYAGPIL